MKHTIDDGVLQSNLLQAFQKNKSIQGQLNERHRLYYIQLMKDMQDYNLKEKFNKELLYTWKKENYVRQLKKNLREYDRKRFGARDAYYEYQARNLDCVLTGQKGLAIPPKEEERRVKVNAKFQHFLKEHPLRTTSAMRVVQSVNAIIDQEKEEEENARGVEETWKHIHAQSAVGLKRKKRSVLPAIQRSLTIGEIKQNKVNSIPPATIVESKVPGSNISEVVEVEKKHLPLLPVAPIHSTIADDIEPIQITSDVIQRETRADLVAMRSIRRPQKNPIDLNITFESRKRIYQINKSVYEYRICPRKCGLQYNSRFDRPQIIDPVDDEDNLLVEMSETTRRRYEDRHQADKNFL
jgi:hypothetical protein